MREILFRGKAINREPNREYRTTYKNGDWVYGLLTNCENYMGFAEMTNTDGVSGIDVDKNTTGQYTGITDKNGKKIFEGDICQHRSYYSDNIVISVVTYTDGQFLALVDENSGFNLSDKLEVIGNIHDNPELLRTPQNDEVRE